jgi:hypothetical protein
MCDLHDIDAVFPRHIQNHVIPDGPDSQVLTELRACLADKRVLRQPAKVV